MRITKSKGASLFALIILSGIITSGMSIPPKEYVISSSGLINYNVISPLHTEGRYIKDDLNRTVFLRGVFKAEFCDTCAGWFPREGYPVSTDGYEHFGGDGNGQGVHDMCRVLRDVWGANFIGIYMVADWWIRNANETISEYIPYTTMGCKDAVKGFIQIAAQYGIYVMVSIYCPNLEEQQRMPYPSTTFPTKEDYTDFYVNDLANELKDYSNVIFCPYDEPVPTDEAEWNSVVQQIINGIRDLPCDNLFLYHYGYCGSPSWAVHQPGLPFDGTNIVYSGTVYRSEGTFAAYGNPYLYDDIKAALIDMGYQSLAENYNISMVNYIGARNGDTNDEEYLAFNSTLACWNEWGQGYAGYQWMRTYLFPLQNATGIAVQPPNRVGQALIDAIEAGKT